MQKKGNKNNGIKLIKKSNQLIEARYKFDIWEHRMFISVLGSIRRDDEDFKTYRIWYKDVIKTFGLKSGQSYGLLRDAARSLMRKVFKVSSMDSGFNRETEYHIIRSVNYLSEGEQGRGVEQQQYVDITFDPQMKPLLLQLQKNFTAYDPRNITKLGIFGLRIYELLKQYELLKSRTLGIEEMKRMFEIEHEYPLFANFYQKIITPSVSDINRYTDITITKLEKIKENKKVVSLRFFFETKPQEQVRHMRNEKEDAPILIPLVNDFQESEQEYIQRLFDKYYPQIGSFWGINEQEFKKRLKDKSDTDIDSAIEFTKEVIKTGAAKNPAGLFLDALSNGHKSKESIKKALTEAKRKHKEEQQAQIKLLLETLQVLEDSYAKALNEGIRKITEHNPEITQQVIETLKDKYRMLGEKITGKTVEDFRKNEMLRGLVKQEIMSRFPENFQAIHGEYQKQIETQKQAIWAIDAHFKFQ